MTKRILFVGLAYYPNVGYGGPVRVMRSYGLALTSLGHEVTIYCPNFTDRRGTRMANHTTETELNGIRVVYMNTNLRLSDGMIISLDLVRYLRREIDSYDVIHLFGPRDFFTGLAAMYAYSRGTVYFIHPMSTINYRSSKVALKCMWDAVIGRRLIHGARYVVEATDEQVKDLLAYGIPASKTAVIPWSPDPNLTDSRARPGQFRERLGIASDEKVILFLGRIHQTKRLDLLLRALAHLDNANIRLVVVGHDDDGSMKRLKVLVSDLKLEKQVIWAGPIHSPESAAAYRDADVFVLVSEHESAPMALLEACSMGVPVLISDHTGMSEMIHNRAGLVVDMTPEVVASGLSTLLRDADLRRRYAVGGQELIAQNFSAYAIGSQLVDLYK